MYVPLDLYDRKAIFPALVGLRTVCSATIALLIMLFILMLFWLAVNCARKLVVTVLLDDLDRLRYESVNCLFDLGGNCSIEVFCIVLLLFCISDFLSFLSRYLFVLTP